MEKVIKITPETVLMKHLGSSGHTLIKALSELIDNAIDSFLEHRDELKKDRQVKVRVNIQFDRGSDDPKIIISDNAYGMTEMDLNNAMVLARSVKSSAKVKELIGRFGMGLKTACSSLGASFSVQTATSDDSRVHMIDYDEEEFIQKKEWAIVLKSAPKKPSDFHGTTITIGKLKKSFQHKSYVNPRLGQLFAYYIENGLLELLIDDEQVKAERPELLTPANAQELTQLENVRARYTNEEAESLIKKLKKTKLDDKGRLEFKFSVGGKEVEGWVGLLKHSSQRGQYGFNLIRHDRIVKEYVRLGFPDHPSTARVIGELHLDDWNVTYNKDDFIRDSKEWRILVGDDEDGGQLREYLAGVLSVSRDMATRQRPVTPQEYREADKAGRDLVEVAHDATFVEEISRGIVEESLRNIERDEPISSLKVITPDQVKNVRTRAKSAVESVAAVRHELVQTGTNESYVSWDIERSKQDKRILVVRTNTDHPFYKALNDSGKKCYFAFLMAECYAECLQKEIGYESLKLIKSRLLATHATRFIEAIETEKNEFKAKV